jgi:hypothetical protein
MNIKFIINIILKVDNNKKETFNNTQNSLKNT